MNRIFSFFKFFLLTLPVVALLLAPSHLVAQATGGSLVGTIFDQSGAAVAGADVDIVNVATNVTARSKTGSSGEYRADNLIPGSYRVTAKASGFKSMSQTVDVLLSKTETLNLTLVPGAATEVIEVSGSAPLIDTTTPQLGTTYEVETLKSIPTAGAGTLGVINLSLLQAGVGSSGGLGAGTGPAVGGQRPRNNNFTIEGIDENDKGVTGPDLYVPNDAVQNFTILQNHVADDLRGRTFATLYTIVRLCLLISLTVGPFIATAFGTLSDVWVEGDVAIGSWTVSLPGVRLALWFGGLVTVLAGLMARRRMRRPNPAEIADA